MVNHGLSGSTNRDNLKSVSFTNDPVDHVSAALKSLVNKIFKEHVSCRPKCRRDKEPTLKFDITMDQGIAVHPPNSLAQFAPNLAEGTFVELQLGSVNVLQQETIVCGCRKRMHEGHSDAGVANVLRTGLEVA